MAHGAQHSSPSGHAAVSVGPYTTTSAWQARKWCPAHPCLALLRRLKQTTLPSPPKLYIRGQKCTLLRRMLAIIIQHRATYGKSRDDLSQVQTNWALSKPMSPLWLRTLLINDKLFQMSQELQNPIIINIILINVVRYALKWPFF